MSESPYFYATQAPRVDGKPAWWACWRLPGERSAKRVSSAYGPIVYATRSAALAQAERAFKEAGA
jgi:hypothetical protein